LKTKMKTNFGGSKRYQVRVAITGFKQTAYGDTYAPVAMLVSFRMLIALAERHGWDLSPMEVVTAFMNPQVEDDVYVELA
jgi:hypothetical protein